MDGHLRPTLLGRLGGVDLKIMVVYMDIYGVYTYLSYVFSEYIIIYNSVKTRFLTKLVLAICRRRFTDVPACSDVADFRCVHRPNST